MTPFTVRELYAIPNGDRWTLARNGDGELVVCHQPTRASGGVVSEIPVDVFLSHGGQGPEHHALSAALAELELSGKNPDASASDVKITEKIDRALGQAVARCWSKLAPEIQQTLFERQKAKRCGRSSRCICTQYVAICVSDNVLERAFEPFYTTKEPGHGAGLGRSQVYGLVTQWEAT
jgi:hypothetical protein